MFVFKKDIPVPFCYADAASTRGMYAETARHRSAIIRHSAVPNL